MPLVTTIPIYKGWVGEGEGGHVPFDLLKISLSLPCSLLTNSFVLEIVFGNVPVN